MTSLRTVVYVDGFNLYFGCLKRKRRYRWLDVCALANRLCRDQDPAAKIVSVKYFTAPVKAKLSPRGDSSCIAQQDYWLALKAHCSNLEIIEGQFFTVSGSYHEDHADGTIDFQTKLRVIRPEEKQTDVNIALHMLADATDELCDQQVLLSNDSDCMPALRMIRQRHPSLQLGVVAPILAGGQGRRQPSKLFRDYVDWVRSTIAEIDLAACQLPKSVPTRKRKICKPAHWE